MKWLSEQGHTTLGIDRSAQAIELAASFGRTLLADIESDPWPLRNGDQMEQFDAVIICNYLWRPLFPTMSQSVRPGGLLIYETFTQGNETVGKPSRPDFLLRPAELLTAFEGLHTIAFEEGFLNTPARFVQRLVAARPELKNETHLMPKRYGL